MITTDGVPPHSIEGLDDLYVHIPRNLTYNITKSPDNDSKF